jgi:dTDP-glucose 4,6-dehydratase
VALICEKLNKPFDANVRVVGERLGKDSAYWLKSDKLRSNLGWAATIGLEQGLEETLNWARTHLASLNTQPTHYIHKP